MKKTTWLAIGRLGSSLAQIATSEWQAVRHEMRRSARASAGAVITLVIGSAFLAVALVGLLFALAQLMSRWMPQWSALLAVSGVFALVAAILIGRARRMLRQVDTPGEVVKRRWRDHRGWMRRQLGGGEQEADRGSGHD